MKYKNTTNLSSEYIEYLLANTPQVTFEITDACNLKCTYCGYGEFYSDYDDRENKVLPEKKAIRLLDYLSKLWNSSRNISSNENIFISFYGGEPLLNMKFIRKIVDYVENELKCENRRFRFSMTTNGLLLHKYIEYLVKHDFHLLISLDGNKENNAYRIDKMGNPKFEIILRNTDAIRDNYPNYFLSNVNFNAVLHNKNTVESIYRFVKVRFNKIPNIGELNNMGIRPDKREVFMQTYRNSEESLYQSEHYSEIEKDMFVKSGSFRNCLMYLIRHSDFVFKDYNELLYGKPKEEHTFPTGTCLPFTKKIYVTVNGKILPCERIGHKFALGEITDTEIKLDFSLIAKKYNKYYAKLDSQCKSCYNKKGCIQCVFNIENIDEEPTCHGCLTKKDFDSYVNSQLNFLAHNPEAYFRIMEEVIVK